MNPETPKNEKIVDFNQFRMEKKPPTGFYAAAQCPKCGSPVFYHGPGVDDEGQQHSQMYYQTCLHELGTTPMRIEVPPHYSFPYERDALDSLFTNIIMMLGYIRRMESQIGVVEEDGGYSDSREQGIRLLPDIRDDDGPAD